MCNRRVIVVALVGLVLALAGCGGSGSAGSAVPPAFDAEAAKAVELTVAAKGAGVSVRSGDATAAVYVPAGAARAGATWRVTPLKVAPAGVKKPLCPGVYVDTSGTKPDKPCAIGFALPGEAVAAATIVRISDDGKTVQVVPSDRLVVGQTTYLTAYVDGFSSYTTSEEDQAAIDKAFVDRANAKGQQVDWTIKAGGTETQTNQGWTFNYELDFFASGGGVGQGGAYKGHAALFMDGKYEGPTGIVSSFGDVKGTGRDQALSFSMVDATLASLLNGDDAEPCISGAGVMNMEGLGQFNATAVAPNVKGQVSTGDVQSKGGVPFTIKVTTLEDVQIEIPGAGIFPGKILRTTK